MLVIYKNFAQAIRRLRLFLSAIRSRLITKCPGWTVSTLGALRRLPDARAVVCFTGSARGRIAIAALKTGAADYVVKTVGNDFFDLLAASFADVLERTALNRAMMGQGRVRASNARLEAVLGEIKRRVANSLQLLSAIVRPQSAALSTLPRATRWRTPNAASARSPSCTGGFTH